MHLKTIILQFLNMSFRDIVIKQIEEKDAKENELEALKEKQTKVETSLNNLSAQQEEMKMELNELNGQQKEMINILTAMTKKLADLTKKLPTKEDKMWFSYISLNQVLSHVYSLNAMIAMQFK